VKRERVPDSFGFLKVREPTHHSPLTTHQKNPEALEPLPETLRCFKTSQTVGSTLNCLTKTLQKYEIHNLLRTMAIKQGAMQ
jgi:hypothetical protein